MDYAHISTSADWMDLSEAAARAGVSYCTLVDAVTNREVRATTTHPSWPGDWMVPVLDVDQWARHAGADRGQALASGPASRA